MFPNNLNLQGGGNIQVGGVAPQPQPHQTVQLQPAQNVLNYSSPSYSPQGTTGVLGPNPPAAPTVFHDTFGNAYGSQTAADAANQTINQTKAAIGRLPNQLNVGYSNIDSGYNSALNQLNQTKANAQQNYTDTQTQDKQGYVTAKNTIGQNAGNSLSGLLRLLGSRGAGGSSAAVYSAPTAVGTQAAQQRAGAGQTYGKNEQANDTNWNGALDQYGQNLNDIGRQRDNSRNTLQSKIDTTRAGLLHTLAGLQSGPSAAQPYLNQENSLLSQADTLGAEVPVFQTQPFVYHPPSLDSYTTNPFAAPQVAQANAQTDAVNPFTSLLFGGQRNKQTNTGAF